MKHLKNKKSLLFGGVLCTVAAIIGVSVAYNQDRSTLENAFKLGAHEIVATEVFTSPDNWKPCDEVAKTLTIQNKSSVDIKIRVKYDEVWRDATDTEELPLIKDGVRLSNIVLQNLDDWELSGGYYYYKDLLAPNAVTSSLFEKVIFDCDANLGADNVCRETASGTVCEKPDDDYERAKYHLKIKMESISANDEWNINVGFLQTGRRVNMAFRKVTGIDVSNIDPDEDWGYFPYWNESVKSLSFVYDLPEEIDPDVADKELISTDQGLPIYVYNDGEGNLYVHSDAETIYANADSSYMFAGFYGVESLELTDVFDTSEATNMHMMFSWLNQLKSIVLPESFNTSRVADMSGMFYYYYDDHASSLEELILSENFDTSNVTNMESMFMGLENVTTFVVPDSFVTHNVTNMNSMFFGMESVDAIPFIQNFDTSRVTDMGQMFDGMESLTSLVLPESFNTSNVTNMYCMFGWMRSLTSLILPESFDTSRVTDMSQMFDLDSALASLVLPESFKTHNATSFWRMFEGMTSLSSLTLPSGFVINDNVQSLDSMFSGVSPTATLNSSADASVRALWPGQLRS